MLHSIKSLHGKKLAALDDKAGRIADCYFEEKNWTVRYFAAETNWWEPPRRVILSPHAFGPISELTRTLPVHLTREQIEKSPSLGLEDPVTRKFETEYYQYYNWPFYWQGDFLWGPSDSPRLGQVPAGRANTDAGGVPPQSVRSEPELRSALGVLGFPIYSGDEVVGRVSDFLMDDRNWRICYLVVKVGHWFSGKILLATRKVLFIDWDRSRVVVSPSRELIERAAARREPHGNIILSEALTAMR